MSVFAILCFTVLGVVVKLSSVVCLFSGALNCGLAMLVSRTRCSRARELAELCLCTHGLIMFCSISVSLTLLRATLCCVKTWHNADVLDAICVFKVFAIG